MQVAVVIATKNRSRLLADRALASVLNQHYLPCEVVVVDDGVVEQGAEGKGSFVPHILGQAASEVASTKFTALLNQRTPGASGAWNTALSSLLENCPDPSQLFVAFLDDDDSWGASYLSACKELTHTHSVDMIATDFIRYESADSDEQCFTQHAPDLLRLEDFLTGNPGIQASNLFVRLSCLLQAGGFDESLQSCTDRDICIRLAEMGSVKYARLNECLVQHYAERDRPRLSNPGSVAKQEGLNGFWQKYQGRLANSQQQSLLARAKELFDWSPPEGAGSLMVANESSLVVNNVNPFSLYIGIISSDPRRLEKLLKSLVLLQQQPFIERLRVVILLNGGSEADLLNMAYRFSGEQFDVLVIPEETQRKDAARGLFGRKQGRRPSGQVSIAQSRTMLQRYTGAMLQQDTQAYVWLLDDDMQIDQRAYRYLTWLPAFRERGVDVLLGQYEGASPNPPLNGLRVQLMDLLHNIKWLETLPASHLLPDRTAENETLRQKFPDYYYDLSRKHSAHLEQPFWLEPAFVGETAGEALARLLSLAPQLPCGQPLTRRLQVPESKDPLTEARDSANRGGCTFVLSAEALSLTPNSMVTLFDRPARRSDMVWAIVNCYYRGLNIKAVGFPVLHAAVLSKSPKLDVQKVQEELVGSSLYSGLMDYLSTNPNHDLNFSESELDEVLTLSQENLRRRIHALRLSFFRIIGLKNALKRLNSHPELTKLIGTLDKEVSMARFHEIVKTVQIIDGQFFREFLVGLRSSADDYGRWGLSPATVLENVWNNTK